MRGNGYILGFSLIILIGFIALVMVFPGKFNFTGYAVEESFEDYKCENCNVILISIDTLRADHLGVYGYSRGNSPNIDEFARDAISFKNMIAQAPSTEPSHASIFTSKIPSEHGALFSHHTNLSESQLTLAEVLKSNGFETVSFNGGGQIDGSLGFGQGFDLYESDIKSDKLFSSVVNKSETWLSLNKDKKFFMFLHTFEVHAPYIPSVEELRLFDEEYSKQFKDSIPKEITSQVNNHLSDVSKEDLKNIISLYDSSIYSMDKSFGELISYLKNEGLYNNTLIVFTADHGEEFEEHTGRIAWHSHTLYEELLRVPLIVKMPNSQFSDAQVQSLASHIDIAPTILSVLGVDIPKDFTGINLLSGKKNRFIISQQDTFNELNSIPIAVSTGEWKFYNNRLFNLYKDPKEKVDYSKEYPVIFKDMNTIIKKVRTQNSQVKENSTNSVYNEELTNQLKSLGYMA